MTDEKTGKVAGKKRVKTDEEKQKDKERKKKKRKLNKWKESDDHANVYVTGLPSDVTFEELRDEFKKVCLSVRLFVCSSVCLSVCLSGRFWCSFSPSSSSSFVFCLFSLSPSSLLSLSC
jgi:hypothetical protein